MPRNYSLKDDKYKQYVDQLKNDRSNQLSEICSYLQFLYKYKSLLAFKLAQMKKIDELKANKKQLTDADEDEKFVLKVELDKFTRGKYKEYIQHLPKNLSYEQKQDLIDQLIKYIQQILAATELMSKEKFEIEKIVYDTLQIQLEPKKMVDEGTQTVIQSGQRPLSEAKKRGRQTKSKK